MGEDNIEIRIKRLIDDAARLGFTVEFYDPSNVPLNCYSSDPFEEAIQIDIRSSEKKIERILRDAITTYVNNLVRENEEKPGLKYKHYFQNELYTVGYTKGYESLNIERIIKEYKTI